MTLNAAVNVSHYDRLALAAARAVDWVTDLVFPPTCGHCGRVDARYCAVCRAELERLRLEITHRPMLHFDGLSSTGKHQGVLASAVQAFKYEGATDLSAPLAERLTGALSELDWRIDSVVPVPLYADRLLERGYNQAALLGERLAQTLGMPFEPGLLGRTRSTGQQARLSGSERLQNVAGAFAAAPAAQGLSILLIDDVVTTGATLSACAAELRAQNAAAVYGIAITHA